MEIGPIGPQTPRGGGVDGPGAGGAVRRQDSLKGYGAQGSAGQNLVPTDDLEISDRGRELARAQQAVEAAPDVRADRVAEIRKSLEDGTYSVSAEQLAAKLLGGS